MNKDSMTRAETILVHALQSLRDARRYILSYPTINGRQEYIHARDAYLKQSEELIKDMSTRAKIAYICGGDTIRIGQAINYANSIGLTVVHSNGTMKERVRCMTNADMIILTDGWEESREPRIIAKLAFDLGIEVIQLNILKILMGHA